MDSRIYGIFVQPYAPNVTATSCTDSVLYLGSSEFDSVPRENLLCRTFCVSSKLITVRAMVISPSLSFRTFLIRITIRCYITHAAETASLNKLRNENNFVLKTGYRRENLWARSARLCTPGMERGINRLARASDIDFRTKITSGESPTSRYTKSAHIRSFF